jgi:tetratricopeptide (TPR) repeat protein
LPADHDMPLPAPDGDLPLPQDFNLPTTIGTSGDDVIPLDGDFDMPGPAHDVGNEDHDFLQGGDFPEAGADLDADLLMSEPPRPIAPPAPDGDAVGDEFAIDQVDERQTDLLDRDDVVGEVGEDGAPKVRVKKKKSKALRIAIVFVPLVVLAGGMLKFTSMGPFGYFAISDTLNQDSYTAKLTSFREAAQDQMGVDTSAEAITLVARSLSEQQGMPRYVPMRAYAAYLSFMQCIRFGEDLESMANGRQLLDAMPPEASGDLVALARAARAAAEGQVSAAANQLAPLTQRMSNDVDAMVLAAEVALLGGLDKEALTFWKQAVDLKKSARSLYGLARAQLRLGKDGDARKNAEAVLKLSKVHAGGRALIAELLWRENNKDTRALELLHEITKKGEVQAAASTFELVAAYALLGDIQLSQSKLTAAKKSYGSALKINPRAERALVGNGELFYRTGRNAEAKVRFEAAFKVNPRNVLAVVGKAKTMIRAEDAKGAKELLIPLAKTSKHPLVGYQLGLAYESLGDRDTAEKAYRGAIKAGGAHPDVVYPYVALATLLNKKGRAEDAENTLAEATEKLPNNPALHNAKGDVALRGGRLDDAKDEFNRALKLEPENSTSRFRLAITHRRGREFAMAAKELDTIAAADPEYPGLALERGALFQETGETSKALAMYNEALKKAPEDIDLKLRVASTQVINGQPQQAIKLLREVLGKRPQSAEVNHFLGRALLLSGETIPEALRLLQNAAQFDPNRAEYQLFVAWAANSNGQPSIAEEAINKALELDENLGDAYWQRGVWLLKKGASADALKELNRALELNPSRFEAYASIAQCMIDQVKPTEAISAWNRAIEGNPKVPEWRYRLGKLLIDKSSINEAAPHLKAAVDLTMERKQTPGWLWNANWLLGESLYHADPKRALTAYKEYLRLTPSDNAYREDAMARVDELEAK